MAVSIIIVEDDTTTRESMVVFFSGTPGYEVLGSYISVVLDRNGDHAKNQRDPEYLGKEEACDAERDDCEEDDAAHVPGIGRCRNCRNCRNRPYRN